MTEREKKAAARFILQHFKTGERKLGQIMLEATQILGWLEWNGVSQASFICVFDLFLYSKVYRCRLLWTVIGLDLWNKHRQYTSWYQVPKFMQIFIFCGGSSVRVWGFKTPEAVLVSLAKFYFSHRDAVREYALMSCFHGLSFPGEDDLFL